MPSSSQRKLCSYTELYDITGDEFAQDAKKAGNAPCSFKIDQLWLTAVAFQLQSTLFRVLGSVLSVDFDLSRSLFVFCFS